MLLVYTTVVQVLSLGLCVGEAKVGSGEGRLLTLAGLFEYGKVVSVLRHPKHKTTPKGSERIEIKGLNNKRQITGVFVGEFLPIPVGKQIVAIHHTNFHLTGTLHSKNHWSNKLSMLGTS